uniref:sigma-70 family RNA polymerase sigma factor n=1 Tax=uncultured Altererythrobacter sp. TaxID=500840 RepID=UPI002618F0F5|nr:sigma-70 family RNA polymerase sigma factor [uncultured Altererythrobacter sp.]
MKHDPSGFAAAHSYATREEVEARIRRFVPMVHRAAWHIFGVGREGMEVEDLMQAGMIALTEAAQKHSGPGEDGFAAYAKMRVRGAMFDFVRRTMPDSRRVVEQRKRYKAASEALTLELGETPSAKAIAERLGCSLADLREIEASQTHLSSIEESYDETNSAFRDENPDPFQTLAALDDRERSIAAMQELPERLQLVLQLFFVEELNLTEIAEVLEVSVPRVHQLRAQALSKLKATLTDTGG